MQILKPKSVDQILSGFTSMMQQLDAVSTHNSKVIDRNAEMISDLQAANTSLATESKRAQRVRAALEQIIDPKDK